MSSSQPSRLVKLVLVVLCDHDPLEVGQAGAGADEYLELARAIALRVARGDCAGADGCQRAVHEELVRVDDTALGDFDSCHALAAALTAKLTGVAGNSTADEPAA